MRTAAGVVAGYVFFAVASVTLFAVAGQEPHEHVSAAFAFVSTVYGMVAAFLGGLMAAAIARRSDQRASRIVAAIIAIGAAISMLTVPPGGSRMSMIAAILLMAPAALLGGIFYRKMVGSAATPTRSA